MKEALSTLDSLILRIIPKIGHLLLMRILYMVLGTHRKVYKNYL